MTRALVIFLMLETAAVANDDVSVRVHLSPAEIPFHRQATFTIEVDAPAEAAVELPNMIDKFGGLSIYGPPQYNTEMPGGGRVRITDTYTLDPIFTGLYPIEPVEVGVGGGESITVPSPALRVRDLTEPEKDEALQFEDALAQPPLATSELWTRWEVWALAVALTAALAAVVFVYRYRRRSALAPDVPPKLPWEVAYDRLRLLDEKKLAEAGKYDPFYVELSSILRDYIEDRFHVHAPEQTTPEFLSAVAGGRVVDEPHVQLLAGFLRLADRVKFAQYAPTVHEMERGLTDVLRFVDDTVPRSEDASREAAA